MAKIDTVSPKVRRMLFYFSPLILGYVRPTSTLLHGHIALAIPSLLETDPQILERWGYADEVHLGKQKTPSDGFFLVSNVGVTYHGLSELNTSDWLQYV